MSTVPVISNSLISFKKISTCESFAPTDPIGIFDSGLGGLVIVRALDHLLPRENFIYFGDLAHMPYGDKSRAAVQAYSVQACNRLLVYRCKMIIIACNTATATSLALLKNYLPPQLLMGNVIQPTVRYVAHHYGHHRLGLIATERTVRSRVYETQLHKRRALLAPPVCALPTPLLAPMIEERFLSAEFDRAMIHQYLRHPVLADIDALILGCTHYPFIKTDIEQYYQGRVSVIDPTEIIAHSVRQTLSQHALMNVYPRRYFYVLSSGVSEQFQRAVHKVLPEATTRSF